MYGTPNVLGHQAAMLLASFCVVCVVALLSARISLSHVRNIATMSMSVSKTICVDGG